MVMRARILCDFVLRLRLCNSINFTAKTMAMRSAGLSRYIRRRMEKLFRTENDSDGLVGRHEIHKTPVRAWPVITYLDRTKPIIRC